MRYLVLMFSEMFPLVEWAGADVVKGVAGALGAIRGPHRRVGSGERGGRGAWKRGALPAREDGAHHLAQHQVHLKSKSLRVQSFRRHGAHAWPRFWWQCWILNTHRPGAYDTNARVAMGCLSSKPAESEPTKGRSRSRRLRVSSPRAGHAHSTGLDRVDTPISPDTLEFTIEPDPLAPCLHSDPRARSSHGAALRRAMEQN